MCRITTLPASVVITAITGLTTLLSAPASFAAAPRSDLSGQWALQLDPSDVGTQARWFAVALPDAQPIHLPGSLQAQGFGNDVTIDTTWTGSIVDRSWFTAPQYEKYRQPGQIKVPFWLQPDKHYVGAAWYQRTVRMAPDWNGRRIVLFLERPHWETRVWIDDQEAGMCNALGTPHQYDLTRALAAAGGGIDRPHRLTIRVDNTVKITVGVNAHSVTDHTQSNWNGIVGAIELCATDRVWIDDLQAYPDLAGKCVTVRGRFGNHTGSAGSGTMTLAAERVTAAETVRGSVRAPRPATLPHRSGKLPTHLNRQRCGEGLGEGKPARSLCSAVPASDRLPAAQPERQTRQIAIRWQPDGGDFTAVLPLGDAVARWDEFHPNLYRLSAQLRGRDRENRYEDVRSVPFGLRDLGTDGTQLAINGRKMFLRGTLECAVFPLTGYPATDVASWRRIIRICKDHGLNHMRFHSWCPPEAAFVAADALGFYFQVECGAWTAVGTGKPIDAWLYDEGRRISQAYGNHPSFVMMAYGNEPGGPERGARYLRKWCTYWKQRDPRRLHTSAAGWPLIAESDYHNTPEPRIQQWGAGLKSIINGQPPQTRFDYRDFVRKHPDKPTVSHEIGQWCVFPNFAEIQKYRGVLKAKNFEIFRDLLRAHHMGDQAEQMLMASGKLQTLCYKADIEAALRTPGFGGFQLLDLHDFPGQGTALVGVLDPFWEEKPYVSADEYRRFCNTTVPLARMDKRVWKQSDQFVADVEVAHFGPVPLADRSIEWKLVDEEGTPCVDGVLSSGDIPIGNGHRSGRIAFSLRQLRAPARYRLIVRIAGTEYENDWDVWVYPERVDTQVPSDVVTVNELDETALRKLRAGGKILLLPDVKHVKGNVAIGFSSIFWNTAWTRGQPPHTLGIMCDPKHAAFASFPTDDHSNWQWWELINGSGAMVLDNLPPHLRPLVQPIDTWFESRRLGLLFEAQVAGGKLMVCGMDLEQDLSHRIVAQQLRHSLLSYMHSDAFAPAVTVTPDAVRDLFRPLPRLPQWKTKVTASSAEPDYGPGNLIDGNPESIWHTLWTGGIARYPHEVTIDLRQPRTLHGLKFLQRQDSNRNGSVGRLAIYASDDGKQWGEPAHEATLTGIRQWQPIRFASPITTRHLRIVALQPIRPSDPWASLAELDVLGE